MFQRLPQTVLSTSLKLMCQLLKLMCQLLYNIVDQHIQILLNDAIIRKYKKCAIKQILVHISISVHHM